MDKLAGRAPPVLNATCVPPIKRMPTIGDDDILPDMVRMTAQLPSVDATGLLRLRCGGQRAAVIYTLIETCKLNEVDPRAWFADVLACIAAHPASRMAELLPWNWKAARQQQTHAA